MLRHLVLDVGRSPDTMTRSTVPPDERHAHLEVAVDPDQRAGRPSVPRLEAVGAAGAQPVRVVVGQDLPARAGLRGRRSRSG